MKSLTRQQKVPLLPLQSGVGLGNRQGLPMSWACRCGSENGALVLRCKRCKKWMDYVTPFEHTQLLQASRPTGFLLPNTKECTCGVVIPQSDYCCSTCAQQLRQATPWLSRFHWKRIAAIFGCFVALAGYSAMRELTGGHWSALVPVVFDFQKRGPAEATAKYWVSKGLWPPGTVAFEQCTVVQNSESDRDWRVEGTGYATYYYGRPGEPVKYKAWLEWDDRHQDFVPTGVFINGRRIWHTP